MVTCVAKPKSGSQEVGTRSNPNLMEGKMFRREALREFLVFLFELLISTLLSGGMGLVSFFFHIASALVFFKEDDPHSIRIELLEGSIAWIDHSRWIGSLWRFWVLLCGESSSGGGYQYPE